MKEKLKGSLLFTAVTSLGYEKACVLFNIAALQSQIGAGHRLSDTDEELKSAAKLLQVIQNIISRSAVAGA